MLVDVGAVEGDVRLVGASAVDGAVAVVGDAGGAVGDAEEGDTGLEAEQVGDVARERRQFHDRVGRNDVTERSIDGVELRGGALHLDRGRGGTDFVKTTFTVAGVFTSSSMR